MQGPSSQAMAGPGSSKGDARPTRQLPTYTREQVKAMIAGGDIL